MKAPVKASGTTLSHQIYMLLRDDILQGRLQPDSRIPSEKTLAEMNGVSRVTIRKALERLESEKLVRRVHGQGTFVESSTRPAMLTGKLEGFIEQADWLTRNTDVSLLQLDRVLPPAAVREAMGLEPDDRVQRSVRLRRFLGKPCLLLETYLPDWLADAVGPEDLRHGSVQVALRRAGIELAGVDYTVSATSADTRLAELLDVPVATALLSMVWEFRDRDHRVVEYQFAHGRPDTYVLSASLRPPY